VNATNSPHARPFAPRLAVAVAVAVAVVASVAGAGYAAKGPDAPFQEVALLDAARGAAAKAAYDAWFAERCKAPASADRARALALVGLADDACLIPTAGAPVASGALLAAGADEVLLVVASGRAAAEGDHTFALMRKHGDTYRLATHLVLARGLRALTRLTTADGKDLLVVCADAGNMGYYPSRCGFLGFGSFRQGAETLPPDEAFADEFELLAVDAAACGTHASVDLGTIALHGDILRVELVLTRVLQQKAPADSPDVCTRRTSVGPERFRVDFDLRGSRPRRTTPIPPAVTKVLESQG
jgi:hypothetical protein